MSRFHLLHGVMAYVSSLLWMLFLAAGTAVAVRAGHMPVDYFPEEHVLFPSWPILDWEQAMTLLLLTAAVLLAPKLLAIGLIASRCAGRARWGGLGTLLASAAAEIALSAVIAPVLMVQQSLAIIRTLAGVDAGWRPQRRRAASLGWPALLRFHAAETVLGLALLAAMALAVVPLWLAPIALSLAAAVPLSRATGAAIGRRHRLMRLFAVPERLDPPPVVIAAHAHGAALGPRAAAAPAGVGAA